METTQIGIVSLDYDNKGKIKAASFEPTMNVVADDALLKKLKTIKRGDPGEVKHNAELVLSTWFSKINNIELADRDKYHVVSEIKHCDMNGKNEVKKIQVVFNFEPITEEANNN